MAIVGVMYIALFIVLSTDIEGTGHYKCITMGLGTYGTKFHMEITDIGWTCLH